ncbi:hypothetical protein HO639_01740 [Streptococcus suis]|uniref:AP2 domain protein n=1 Tax=Streptococcus suis TaxID=1307 RepID=A0A0Z8G0Q4_STRSU|nr:hypothetical protein [Streptococcus suis]NQH31078.1 hypothetical protein [Streptococcus suis]NQH47204.1 hypothetical protein [Streptococcus suis]NQH67615.1 hypothetical protein [Streptococcus suis]NQP28227.1 hypothetical protein [Streptococcus suis]NQP39203.1 hypothetical protein [Streptococcus suis]
MIKDKMHKHLNQVYYSMLARCYDEKHWAYKWYGKRGIGVSEEFGNVASFRNWAIENGAEFGLQLDRIDNNKDYSPENCRWVTEHKNKRNRSDNVFYKGYILKDYLKKLSKEHDISFATLVYRYYQSIKRDDLVVNDDTIDDILLNYKKYDLRQFSKGVDMSDKIIVRDEKGRIVTYYRS